MRLPTLFILLFFVLNIFSQSPGDQIFAEDQVIKVDLDFSQTAFWDSLVANYPTETYMKANVTITDNISTQTFNDIGIRLKGNSSYGHPGDKKSFKIDFNRYIDSLEYDGLKKLNFNNGFKDPTFMREKIVYDLSSQAGVAAPRCNYAEIYMNEMYWGFYTVVEQVDDEFLKTHFDNKSENLFKAGAAFGMGMFFADLKYYGSDTAEYQNRYSLENNSDENNWTDLIELTDFINNSSDEEFANLLGNYFNVDVLMKSLVIDNLFSNLDSYTNSTRNYYIYHNGNSGVWEWIKWDCNEAFGSYKGAPDEGIPELIYLDPGYFAENRPLLERAVTIPAARVIYDDWYCEIKNIYFTPEYLFPIIDGLSTLIQSYVYADYNKMYSNAEFDTNIESDIVGGGPMSGTIYGLKSFITERNDYLNKIISCEPLSELAASIGNSSIQIYPNPATDIINISFKNMHAATISIFDATGKNVKSIPVNQLINQLNIEELSPGLYTILIDSGETIQTKLFVKL